MKNFQLFIGILLLLFTVYRLYEHECYIALFNFVIGLLNISFFLGKSEEEHNDN